MTTFPGSPRLLKGAIVGIDPLNPLARVIVFQYNPTKLTRSLTAQTETKNKARPEVLRLKGAPRETITISKLDIDATDQLEQSDPITAQTGIYPQLSALEMLLYPKGANVIVNTARMLAGMTEITAPEAPLTLFIWGIKRVVPVHITNFTITEQEFDPQLNPIRAQVSQLKLTVLSYNDFSASHPGYWMFLGHQMVKEAMAVVGGARNIARGLEAIGGSITG